MTILKLFPADPFFIPEEKIRDLAIEYLVKRFPDTEIDEGLSPLPQFIDCGEDLSDVRCPLCGASIDSDDWAAMMDSLYGQGGFEALDIIVPCCEAETTLDRLEYIKPCGFGCYEIDVIEPKGSVKALAEELSAQTGVKFRAVTARV